jgi:hypothetical protein
VEEVTGTENATKEKIEKSPYINLHSQRLEPCLLTGPVFAALFSWISGADVWRDEMNYSFIKTVLQRFAVVLGFAVAAASLQNRCKAGALSTVARISYVSGPVSYSRGDYPDEWDEAAVNVPFTVGDRIYLPEDGRAELQLPSGNVIRLAPRSYFSALNLAYDVKQFYLGEGAAFFNIRRLASDEIIEIDTPNVSVTLEQEGRYRIEVDQDGNSRISVRRGKVIVAASGRQITMGEGELTVYGLDSPRYEVVAARNADGFDRWVAEREADTSALIRMHIVTRAIKSSVSKTSLNTADGKRSRSTVMPGPLRASRPVGRPTVSAAGSGRTHGGGRGSPTSHGVGRRVIMVVGHPIDRAGIGCRSGQELES